MTNRPIRALTFMIVATGTVLGSPLNSYDPTNLVSDLSGVAKHQDPNLVNPWGLVAGATTPFWVADNGTGLSTLYDGKGAILPLVVTIPPAPANAPPSNPTGIVHNGSANFGGAPFLFATESGTIASWAGGANAIISALGDPGSIYKGLAINEGGGLLYAANFGLGRIDVYNSNFDLVSSPGGFTDPSLPAGYAPFNIQNIDGMLYVTYAATSGGTDETDGPGLGFVDVFNLDGVFQNRVASQGALNAPWGLALAPANFGAFSNDLLVGNFGDGTINAYDLTTDTFVGTLDDRSGNPISILGLWGLSFGNGAHNQPTNTLYFNAGIPGPDDVEDHGLFGRIDAVPEPGQLALTAFALATVLMSGARRLRRRNG